MGALQYVYVSPEQMAAVAAHVRQAGRITIKRLTQDVPALIGLDAAPSQ